METFEQKPDADHLALPEGVGEAEKGHGDQGPCREIVAGGHVEIDLAADGEQHHQYEDADQKQACDVAGRQVEQVERPAHHRLATAHAPGHAPPIVRTVGIVASSAFRWWGPSAFFQP